MRAAKHKCIWLQPKLPLLTVSRQYLNMASCDMNYASPSEQSSRLSGLNQVLRRKQKEVSNQVLEQGRTKAPKCDILLKVEALCKRGHLEQAAHTLDILNHQGRHAPVKAYLCFLQSCIKTKAVSEGKKIHTHIVRNVFKSRDRLLIWNMLISLCVKSERIGDARQMFDLMPDRDVFSWTIMIGGYARHGQAMEALNLFCQMQAENVKPDKVTFVALLTACAALQTLEHGKWIHSVFLNSQCELNVFIGNSLVDMYAKCGSIEDAGQVFVEMPERDEFIWTRIIAAYAQHGHGIEALNLFEKMKAANIRPDTVTFLSVVNACASIPALGHSKRVHADILKGQCQIDVFLYSSIVDMYAKCGSTENACKVFDAMPVRGVVAWNIIIAAYTQKDPNQVLKLFGEMHNEAVNPNKVTYLTAFAICAGIRAWGKGKFIHSSILRMLSSADMVVWNAAMDMYMKCGSIEDMQQVFDWLPERDAGSWSTVIAGCAQLINGSLKLLDQMRTEHVKPDTIIFINILCSCASTSASEIGKLVHAFILKTGCDYDGFVGSSLIGMYIKCGRIEAAREVFDALPVLDTVSWNTMLAGYAQHGDGKEAFDILVQMQSEDVKPDKATFASLLTSCAGISALQQGRQVVLDMEKSQCGSDITTAITLIDMYGKCGCIQDARQIFDNLPQKSAQSWSAMIAGYAHYGDCKEVLILFREMLQEGARPDELTFISVLSACSHTGFVNDGCYYFILLVEGHHTMPVMRHYSCMVDLLCRAAYLDEAEQFIGSLPLDPGIELWRSLLAACKVHNSLKLAELIIEQVVQSGSFDSAAFILLSNIYAT